MIASTKVRETSFCHMTNEMMIRKSPMGVLLRWKIEGRVDSPTSKQQDEVCEATHRENEGVKMEKATVENDRQFPLEMLLGRPRHVSLPEYGIENRSLANERENNGSTWILNMNAFAIMK